MCICLFPREFHLQDIHHLSSQRARCPKPYWLHCTGSERSTPMQQGGSQMSAAGQEKQQSVPIAKKKV